MAFQDAFRISVHAAIFDSEKKVLLVKATYGDFGWGLPGGCLEPGETIHEALSRECREEIHAEVQIECLTGVYYHKAYNSQVFIFRCTLPPGTEIKLSSEHSDYRYFAFDELQPVQKVRIQDCLDFDGRVRSAKF